MMRVAAALLAIATAGAMAEAAPADAQLVRAVRIGDHETAVRLLDAGADPETRDRVHNATLMHWAADADMVNLLLSRGATLESLNDEGLRPLHFAVIDGRTGAIKALVAGGADVDGGTMKHGITPLMNAARKSTPEVARALLEAGADVNAATREHANTPLHFAAEFNSPEMAEVLVIAGADVNAATSKFGNTPLHLAAQASRPKMAEVLIRAGADLNARTRKAGSTPLYRAAKYNDAAMVEALLDAGADPAGRLKETANDPGFTAYDGAMKYNSRKLLGTAALARLRDGAAACDGHIVQPGDSRLGIIADRALGDSSRWPEIARLNGIDAKSPYRLGQCLALP